MNKRPSLHLGDPASPFAPPQPNERHTMNQPTEIIRLEAGEAFTVWQIPANADTRAVWQARYVYSAELVWPDEDGPTDRVDLAAELEQWLDQRRDQHSGANGPAQDYDGNPAHRDTNQPTTTKKAG